MNNQDTARASSETSGVSQRHSVSSVAFESIVIALALVQGTVVASIYYHWSIWITLALTFVASHLMHGLLIGFHEASHGLLRRSRRLNEFDGTLIGIFSLMSFSLYRAAHQTHHAHLGAERDEELWPFNVPGTPRWVRVLAAILELTFGIFFTPFLFIRTFVRKGSPIRNQRLRRRIWWEFALTGTFWVATSTTVALLDLWAYFFWLYAAPAWLAANMQSWRKYIEHVGLTGDSVNSSTRSIVCHTWIGRFLAYSLLHEPYHGVHHHQSGLPHGALPKYVDLLEPQREGEMRPFQTYRQALWDLLRNLRDPKVGAQWLTPAEARERSS
jgi:fatty acid desaturase